MKRIFGSVVDQREILKWLKHWPIAASALHPGGSNYVFIVELQPASGERKHDSIYAVYKPRTGEIPLQDFPPSGLFRRERAAYLLSTILGWPLIPPTVIRTGPHGLGSVQLYIKEVSGENYFTMRERNLEIFESIAVFDALVHNADRKGGSCLMDESGAVWAIDHGLTFNPLARVRTVMLEFSGRVVSKPLVQSLIDLSEQFHSEAGIASDLASLLGADELDALRSRLNRLIDEPILPILDPRENVPWPLF